MISITADNLADALLAGGYSAAQENFLLSQDADVPIFPEALVQVEVAKALRDRLAFTGIEMEAATEGIVRAASGRKPDDPDFPNIGRIGKIDIVCWQHFIPQVFVEVKDQISGTDDGIVADAERLQALLGIVHKWGEKGPHARTPVFGGILYFVGKNSQQYKHGRHLASQFIPYADRSVTTSVKKVRQVIDESKFNLIIKKSRVLDSAKDSPAKPELIGTIDEETVSGSEQFTYCVACVLSVGGSNS